MNTYLGAALFGIVLFTGMMTYAQERRTEAVLARIHGLLAARCLVVRDGQERRIDAAQLVPGDLVRLALGDRVPADLRVVASDDLRTDKSGITGESNPVRAFADADAPTTVPLHATSLVFNGSLCVAGEGFGVVIRTGNDTMIGVIASLAAGTAGGGQTTLQREVHHFVMIIAIVAVLSACSVFIIGMSRAAAIHHGKIPRAAFVNALVNGLILIVVANTPEGLPATLTSCLAITAKRMAQRHVIIKRLDIIESLGSATVICTDKTGTLTENRMTVEHLWYSRSVFHAATAMGLHQRERAGAALAADLGVAVAPKPAAEEGGPAELQEVPPAEQQSLASAAMEGEPDDAETSGFTTTAFTVSGPAAGALLRQRRRVPPWRAFSPHIGGPHLR